MGNCVKYNKAQDFSINLAHETVSKPDDPEMPDYDRSNPEQDFLGIPDGVSNNEEPIVEFVEIDHFKRPMIRRCLTSLYTKPAVTLSSPKSNGQSRRFSKNDFANQSQLKKHSFLFKAKEKLKKCRTSHVSYVSNEHSNDYNTDDSTDGLHSSAKPESSSKLDHFISSPKGDDEPECSWLGVELNYN